MRKVGDLFEFEFLSTDTGDYIIQVIMYAVSRSTAQGGPYTATTGKFSIWTPHWGKIQSVLERDNMHRCPNWF